MATLRFVSAGAAHGLVGAIARDAGVVVEGSFGAVGAQLEKFRAGEPCDVVILTHVQVAQLTAAAQAVPGTAADLGAVPTSLAVRASDPAPDISGADGLRAALLAADAIYFPDPAKATAGIHFAGVLDKLGIREQVAARVKTFPNGATAMRALAEAGGHPIGCTQSTEILATAGVKLAAPLPRGLDLETVYTAALSARATDAKAARAFVERLAHAPAARARAGFRGFAIRPATPEDFAAIRGIVHAILAEYRFAPEPSATDSDIEDIAGRYFARRGHFDVVTDAGGKVVGCCGVYPHDGQTCELRKMYLVKEVRGHGLGRRLLERALAFARGAGYRRIELETASVLKEAIALYAATGFTRLERAPATGRCDQAFALDLS